MEIKAISLVWYIVRINHIKIIAPGNQYTLKKMEV
jgi:hypothetical protein